MTKFPAVNSKQVVAVLKKIGFQKTRQSGSHAIFRKGNKRTVVPMHSKKILKRKIVKDILSDADLTIEEFRKLL